MFSYLTSDWVVTLFWVLQRIDAQTTWNIYLRYRDGWEEALQAGEDVTGAIPAHYMDWYY